MHSQKSKFTCVNTIVFVFKFYEKKKKTIALILTNKFSHKIFFITNMQTPPFIFVFNNQSYFLFKTIILFF